jgi:site-specific recombinase XerD
MGEGTGRQMDACGEGDRRACLQGCQQAWNSLGRGISENVVWYVVRQCALRLGLEHLAPHDLRRTCAKLCHVNGGELEQIQFLLGHASVLTTERYLGCKQNLEEPVNDRFGCLFSRTLDE